MDTLAEEMTLEKQIQALEEKLQHSHRANRADKEQLATLQREKQEEDDHNAEVKRQEDRLFHQQRAKDLEEHRKNDAARALRMVITEPKPRDHELLVMVPLHTTAYEWLWNAVHVPTLDMFSERLFELVNLSLVWKEHREAFAKKQQSYMDSTEYGEMYFPYTGLGRMNDAHTNSAWMAQFLPTYFYALGHEWLTVPLIQDSRNSTIYPLEAHYILTTSAILAYKELGVAYAA